MSKTSKSQDKNKVVSMRSFISPAYNKLDKSNLKGAKRKVGGSVVKKSKIKINSESEIFRT